MAAISPRPPGPVTHDEEDLVERAKHDPQAFALLYHRNVDAVYRYCHRRLGSKEEAEDAASQIFTQALAALPRLGSQPFRPWLFAIAHNVVVDIHRRRRRFVFSLPTHETHESIDPDPTPEGCLLAAEDGRFVRALLAQLPPDSRQLLELRLAGLTDIEIAAVTGKSHGAVRAAQHRTVVRLRALRAAIEERGRVLT